MHLDFEKNASIPSQAVFSYTNQLYFSFKLSLIFSVIRRGFVSLGTEFLIETQTPQH